MQGIFFMQKIWGMKLSAEVTRPYRKSCRMLSEEIDICRFL